jgi:hypothetical protein
MLSEAASALEASLASEGVDVRRDRAPHDDWLAFGHDELVSLTLVVPAALEVLAQISHVHVVSHVVSRFLASRQSRIHLIAGDGRVEVIASGTAADEVARRLDNVLADGRYTAWVIPDDR